MNVPDQSVLVQIAKLAETLTTTGWRYTRAGRSQPADLTWTRLQGTAWRLEYPGEAEEGPTFDGDEGHDPDIHFYGLGADYGDAREAADIALAVLQGLAAAKTG